MDGLRGNGFSGWVTVESYSGVQRSLDALAPLI
jgi:hypothetical protein